MEGGRRKADGRSGKQLAEGRLVKNGRKKAVRGQDIGKLREVGAKRRRPPSAFRLLIYGWEAH